MRSARHGRLLATSAIGVLALTMGPAVLAGSLPSSGVVAAGQAQIGQSSPSALTINQQSSRAIINWDGFSVGQGQSVQFNNGAGATLNRVTGAQGSAIDGLLSATGSIYLINPNGVIIGKTGIVNVGGTFVAATQNVLDSQFMAGGDLTFSGSSTAAVINYGKIGSLGGDVALIAAKVDNEGEIDAPNGDAGLVSGYTVIMRDMALDSGKFAVQVGGPDTSATNAGQIKAAEAELRANGGNVYALAGNTASVIKADGVAVNDGKVFLVADGGTVNVSGTTVEASASDGSGGQIAVTGQTVSVDAATVLDASATSTTAVKNGGAIKVNADAALSFKGTALARGGAAGGDGGSVETSGATVDFDGALVDTTAANGLVGNWLIDPYDLTVTATAASTISTSLGSSSVTLSTTATGTTGAGTSNANGVGDITILGAISWSSNNTLTLSAYRNDNIYAAITASGSTGKVALLYGQGAVASGNTATYNVSAPVNLKAGSNFSTKLGSNGTTTSYTVITALGAQGSTTKTDLQGISGSLTTNYVLGANIDASATATWNRSGSIYQGFSPLGSSGSAFKGIFDGLGHTVSNLNINRSSTSYAGLFGNSTGTIKNVSLVGGSVTGSSDVGALVGNNSGVLNNVSASTAVTATATSSLYVGGLVGYSSTAIGTASATGNVSSNGNYVGGLVGYSTVAIAGEYATGTVSGASYVGGLAGYSGGGINQSSATGNVTGSNQYAGGLTGYNTGGAITNSHATGTVSGFDYVGGLVGQTLNNISGSYASGNVTSTDSWVGGLAGYSGGGIVNSSASGTVIGNYQYAGGLTGYNTGGAITGSSATGKVSGYNYVGGLAGYNDIGSSISSSNATIGAVSGYDYVGGLVGQSLGNISGSYASGNVTGTDSWVGGLTGYSGGTIDSSNASGSVIGNYQYAGGLTGYNTGAITNSHATGAVSGYDYVGGLAGESLGKISGSYASGNVTGNDSWVGGLTGYSSGGIDSSNASGTVIGSNQYAGGLTGYNTGGAITNSYATGAVSGYDYVGGLAGYSDTNISSSHAIIGAVSGYDYVGGLVGQSLGYISGSYASGNVTSTDNWVGGLTGYSGGGISDSNASGTVIGNVVYAGGLTGYNTGGNIINSFATGSVSGAIQYIGGLVGYNDTGATITNSNATGAVSGYSYIGGLAGYSMGDINGSYAAGNITGSASDIGGLAGYSGGNISNAYAIGNVMGGNYTGGLTGQSTGGAIANSFATGTVSGDHIAGGLVGYGSGGLTITGSYATGAVSGTTGIGGLIGGGTGMSISDSYATGAVTGTYAFTGGLAGYFDTGAMTDVYATGAVTNTGAVAGGAYTGGLVGYLGNTSAVTTVTNAYATGNVTAGPAVAGQTGGLIGATTNGVSVTNAYATGNVIGTALTGGLAGENDDTILNAYATGSVTGTTSVGGLVGSNYSHITNTYSTGFVSGTSGVGGLIGSDQYSTVTSSYWNTQTSGQSTSANGTPLTTAQFQTLSTFTNGGWSIDDQGGTSATWRIYDGQTAPLLRSFMTTLDLSGSSNSRVYNGATQTLSLPTGTDPTLLTVASGLHAGTYQSASVQQGYDIIGGLLTITSQAITITAAPSSKVYNGTTAASATPTVTSGTLYDTATLSETYAGKDVGSAIKLTPTAIIANASDYTITYISTNLGIITPATLTASLTGTVSKVYNDSISANLTSGNYSLIGIVAGDSVSLNGPASGTYDTVHAGTGKTVSVTGLTLANNNAGDYVLAASSLSAAIGAIMPEAITVTATANSKVYNGTVAASATPTVTSGTLYDPATLSETYAGKDVGNAIKLTPTATIANASDYNVTYVASNLGIITPATLTASLTGTVSKVYNASTAASLASGNYSLTGIVAGDSVSLNGPASGTYDTIHAGTGKTVSVTGLTLANNAAGDYVLAASTVSAAIGTITPATLTASLTGTVSKVYNDSIAANLTSGNYSLTGIVAGDSVSLNVPASGTYDTVHAGTGKTVSVTGLTLANNTAGDYVLAASSLSAAIGTITPEAITVTATANSKVYDGTTTASAAPTVTSGTLYDTATFFESYAGKDVGSTIKLTPTATIANAGDYAITYVSSNLGVITPATLTASLTGTVSKVYDSSTAASLASGNYSLTGIVAGDSVSLNGPVSGTYDTVHAGTGKTVSVSGLTLANNAAGDYVLAASSLSAAIGTITPEAITVTATANSKVYDGTTTASATPTVTSGTLYDAATLSESYASKDAGNAITLTPTATIANASDYAVTYVASNLGVITPATLTASLTGTVSKVYDSSTAASLASGNYSLTGIVAGDSVGLNGPASGTYDTVHAGTGKTVSVSGLTLANNAAGDYVLAASTVSAAIGTITPEAITVTATANSKVYDGTTVASATPTVTSGTLYDTATLSESYAGKDVGSTIALTPTATIANASDYNVTYVATNLGVITPATLTASLTGTVSKVYDSSTAASLASGNYSLTGIVAGDSVSLNGPASGTYDTVHAGTGKTVSVTGLTLANNTAGDYVLAASSLSAAIGTITPEAITVTASANSKVYNGTTTASATPTVTSGTLYDTATLSESYASKDAGNAITLTPTATIANAGDYAVTYASSNLGVITPATLTASLTGTVSKVYDSSTAATLASGNYSLTGIVAGDSVSLNGPASGTYDTVHAGTGKTVSVTGLTLANNTAGDYVLAASSLSAAIGAITPEAITVTATANSKVYNGTTTASATPTVTSGTLYDAATLSESYASKDAGNAITLTPTATIANAGDYNVTYVSSSLGVITPATLTASLTGTVSKVYDSSTAASLASGNYSLTGIVAGDSVSLNGPASGTYDTVHAGTGKTVSVTGLTLANNAAGDYVLAASSLSAAIGAITPEAITVTATANSKVYDGTTIASAAPIVTSGTLYDTASLSETYAGKDVGNAIKLTPTATIANAGDYAVTYVATNLGVITPATLSASLTGTVSKVYDSSTAATLASGNYSLAGIVAGDSVSLNGPVSGTYDTIHAGTGKAVSVTGLTLANNTAGDYVLAASTVSAAIGTITPEAITVTATANSKVYNGTVAASATPTVTSGTLYDAATLSESYAGKDVGNAIKLTPTATIANAGDYAVTYVASNLGVITPATLTATVTGTITKTYDSNYVAPVTTGALLSLSGVVAGDSVSLTAPTAAQYDTPNVGTGKKVGATGYTLIGASAGNYTVNSYAFGNVGTITPEAVTITATANSKVYNGTTTASATPTVTSGTLYDTATLSESYASKDAGNAITLTPTATIANAGNYAVTYVSSNLGIITPATLTASLTGTVSKVYNNSNTASLASGNYSLTGIVAGDSVSLNGPASGTYDTVHAGTGKTVSVTGLTLANNNAGDYVLAASSLSAAIGAITPEAITVTATANSKVYNGATTASATPTVTSGTLYDAATLSETYAGKDVGNAIKLTPTATIANASDYSVTYIASNLGVITPATLTATITGTVEKTYDGNYVAPVTTGALLSLTGVVAGDSVSLTAPTSAQYDTPNVGTGKKVGATGYSLTGASAGDYTVNSYAFGNVGIIDPKALTASITGTIEKTYSGNNFAIVPSSQLALAGVVSGDSVGVTASYSNYDNASAGTGKTVYATGLTLNGSSAANYTVSYYTTGNVGIIDPKAITASLTGTVAKTYDGTTTATLSAANYTISGIVTGDQVGITNTTGTYANKNAGSNIAVTVNGLQLGGAQASDYKLTVPSLTAAVGVITPQIITFGPSNPLGLLQWTQLNASAPGDYVLN